jgi:hypothetical protein
MRKGEHDSKRRVGDRGLVEYCEIEDAYANRIRVQTSSSVEPRAWIFVKNEHGEDGIFHLGRWQGASPHLSPSQARRLAKALLRFADDADGAR